MAKSRPILFSTAMVEAILAGRKSMTRRVLKAGFDANSMVFEKVIDHYSNTKAGYNLTGVYNDELGTQAYFNDSNSNNPKNLLLGCKCPFGVIGDELWVKETYQDAQCFDYHTKGFVYKADKGAAEFAKEHKINWRPSIYMPREASRICLEITGIRVERLCDISEADAVAEGVETKPYDDHPFFCTIDYEFAERYKKRGSDFRPGYCADTGDQFRKSFSSLWRLINGKESWELNPWVWVVEFKRKEVKDGK